jgi:chromate transporter
MKERRRRMSDLWKRSFTIFWFFFKLSPVTFGGGYALIPEIEKQVVVNKRWLKTEDLTDIFALAQSVPGAIAVNTAIFIGYRIGGIRGSIAATIGILIPTFTIVLLLGIVYIFMRGNELVEAAFMSIRASIVALIVYAGIKISKTSILDFSTFLVFLIALLALLFINIHPIFVILGGMIVGIVLMLAKDKLKNAEKTNSQGQEKGKDKAM